VKGVLLGLSLLALLCWFDSTVLPLSAFKQTTGEKGGELMQSRDGEPFLAYEPQATLIGGISDQIVVEAYPDKAQYRPGQVVNLIISVHNGFAQNISAKIEIQILQVLTPVATLWKDVLLPAKTHQQLSVEWLPPVEEYFKGYGVDIRLFNAQGQILAETSTAFDVAKDWTLSPRYGFLCDFAPNEVDSADKLLAMNKFHINAVQFYDWLYRHDTLLPPYDEFQDPLGRLLSLRTIQNKIALAHEYNMAAMAYTAIYGASKEFYLQHKDWALYRPDGEPWTLDLETYGDFLYIMNPETGTGWREHLLNQFQAVLEALAFDGIHIDQYGEPRFAFDHEGKLVNLAPVFASFINETKEVLCKKKSSAKVVFNAVNNWPIQAVAPANQDIVYVEVWPPHVTYQDLATIIDQGRRLSGGKKVVLAAYIPPTWEASVRLADAVIFANGGFHIEIGELNGMLSGPYFPKYQLMGPRLTKIMRGYYDFLVRYGNILHDSVEDTDKVVLILDNIRTPDRPEPDTIWTIVKKKGNLLIVNLINLLGVDCFWREEKKAPRVLKDVRAKLFVPKTEQIIGIYLASPDFNYGRAVPLYFEEGTGSMEFTIPRLEYWDLLIIEIK